MIMEEDEDRSDFFEYICPCCLKVYDSNERNENLYCKKCGDDLILIVNARGNFREKD